MSPSSTPKFCGIFVSYRRDDSSGHAGRLADSLVRHFGKNRIFVDVDTIEPGEDFVAVIENAVGSCEILIAVIGQNWLSATGGTGRLDNPNDFVRLEIATALRRDIRVIPVLVQRANMPKAQDLPEDLVKLTRRNAIELTDSRWQSDVDELISVMERVLAKRVQAQQLAGANQADEEPKRPVDKQQLLPAEKAKSDDRRRNVEGVPEAQGFRADVEGEARAEQEDIPPEERHATEAPVRESHPAHREHRDAPATIVTTEPGPPPGKHRNWMLIGGAALIVLLAATFLIWISQSGGPSSPGNTQAPTPQPSLAQSTPTPEVKPTPPPDPFGRTTLWRREDTGSIYKIVREGNTLRAYMDNPATAAEAAGRRKGDLAFEASYEGKTIKGTSYLLFSDAVVRRCPEFGGDQPFALSLSVSEDGTTLNGSREDYKVADDACQKVPLSRRRLTFTKASR